MTHSTIISKNVINILNRGLLFFLLFLGLTNLAVAQTYPVAASIQLIPPYSVYLSDYSSTNADNLRLMLLFNDQFKDNIDIKLRFKIEGSGVKIQTDPNYQPPPYTLNKSIPEQLSGYDFSGYFNANNLLFSGSLTKDQYRRRAALPDGYYRFCVQAFDYRTNAPLSDEVCASAWFVYNDPPRMNQPSCGLTMKILDPQFIMFSWLPMHSGSPNAAFTTEYTFQLVQIMPKGRNPNDAMLSGITIYETTTTAPQIIYGPAEPALMAGEQYAWRVQAKEALGRDLFKNNGFSEVCWFTYGNSCDPPENIFSSVEGAQRATINWDAAPATNQYSVEFREFKSVNKNWYGVTTINTRQTLTNLRPNTTYEYRVKCICGVNSSDYAKADTFHTRQIAQSTMLSCGQTPLKETIDSTKKLAALHKGDEVTIQDFVMTIVEASGSNGRFSGMATIPIKMLNTTLYTEFKNIGINDQYQVYAGSVKVTSGMIALLPPDLKAKVLEKYNEIIAIGDEIDNGLGKADQLITKGTEIYNKASDIYDDVKDKVNSADKLKDGTKDIKSGINAANDGDTTKGKSLIKKGIDAIDKALNGVVDAVASIGKLDDLFKRAVNEKKDTLTVENEALKPERIKRNANVKEKINNFNGFNFDESSQTNLSNYGSQSDIEPDDKDWAVVDKKTLGSNPKMKDVINAVEQRDTIESKARKTEFKLNYLKGLLENTPMYLSFVDRILIESKDLLSKYDLKNFNPSDGEKILVDLKKILDIKLEEESSKQ